jgi:hypothetical protein
MICSSYVNAMDGCTNKQHYCNPDSAASGYVPPAAANNKSEAIFCDYIAYSDAIEKLQYAAKAQARQRAADTEAEAEGGRAEGAVNGKGFFLVVGIRRPHLSFRAPKAYSDMYESEHVIVPAHPTLHESIEPIAWVQFGGLGGDNPYNVTDTSSEVLAYRRAYYAAVSWGDYCVGKVQ